MYCNSVAIVFGVLPCWVTNIGVACTYVLYKSISLAYNLVFTEQSILIKLYYVILP